MSIAHSLTAEELRVLACLIEKAYTTPDQYPLSTNALTTACNQKTSRDPVVDYGPQLVDQTLQLLRDAGWVRMIRASGSRAFKHRHVVDEKLGLAPQAEAVLAVLALRGPQSPGELKTRTERYHRFEDPAAVEQVLRALAEREEPLTRNVGRAPGQSQDRWVQLLGPAAETPDPVEGAGFFRPSEAAPPAASTAAPVPSASEGELLARVERLERRLAALERELGLAEDDAEA
ncbi:MAG: YceH family protein [Actinomycetota bacterium]